MNHSVETMTPKTKIFSKPTSLLTRVMLCGGAQIVGHQQLWEHIFDSFDISLDQNLSHHLTKKDLNKMKRQALQCTPKYLISSFLVNVIMFLSYYMLYIKN